MAGPTAHVRRVVDAVDVDALVADLAELVEGAPYGSDLRHYAAHGIPTVQFGPGELAQAHAVDESVRLADVVACARAYAVLALRRCGAPPQRQG